MAVDKSSPRDNALWALALLILAAGVAGFFYYDDAMLLVRVLGIVAAVVVALIVVARTERGRGMFSYMRETDVERRKVVWPTRQETLQTTLIVLVITIIVAIMLFLMDTLFGWIVRRLIGAGGAG